MVPVPVLLVRQSFDVEFTGAAHPAALIVARCPLWGRSILLKEVFRDGRKA